MWLGDSLGRGCYLTLLLSENFPAKQFHPHMFQGDRSWGDSASSLWEGCSEVATATEQVCFRELVT